MFLVLNFQNQNTTRKFHLDNGGPCSHNYISKVKNILPIFRKHSTIEPVLNEKRSNVSPNSIYCDLNTSQKLIFRKQKLFYAYNNQAAYILPNACGTRFER